MASISRLTLPSEFQDAADAVMLAQPQPAFFWARLTSVAQMGAEIVRSGSPFGPNADRKLVTSGAAVPSLESMQLQLGDPETLASLASYKGAIVTDFFKGATPKQVVTMNRPVFTDSTYTEASRDVTRATISTTALAISGEQVSITILRKSGPYSNSAAAVQPYGIEGFDANFSLHNFSQLVELHLQRDRQKYLDSVIGSRFVTGAPSENCVYPGDPSGSLSAAGSTYSTQDNAAFLTQGDRLMDVPALHRAVRVLQEAGVPTFANGRYMAVLSTKQVEDLKNSSSYQRLAKYFPEKNPLFRSYLSTIGDIDIFQSSTNGTATANSTITVQQGVAFGPGAVAMATANPCHVECGDDTNFGQRVTVLWMADEGYQTIDNRFLVSLRSN